MRSVWRPEVLAILAGAAVILGLYIAAAVAQAVPMTVDIDAVKKFEGFPAGFKLIDPNTGQPEVVVINAEVVLAQGEFTSMTGVALGTSQEAGDAGFLNFGSGEAFGSVDLPLPVPPDYADIVSQDLTQFLPKVHGSPQGTLFVDVAHVQTIPDAFGYGYGYRGGRIKFTIRYRPPELAGTYRATVTTFFDLGGGRNQLTSPSTTVFEVVPPFLADDVKALATAYPRGETEALSRDRVVLQAKVKDDVAPNVVSVTVDPGLLGPATLQMDRNTEFHQALKEKWGIGTNDPGYVNFLLPLTIVPQAEPLICVCEATIKVVDIAGQEVNLSGSSGAKVKLVETREGFNVYLMPGFNFVSTPLQCSAGPPACTQEFGFDIATLLTQPATNAAAGATLADIVSIIWYYCAEDTDSTCPGGGGTPKFVSFAPGRAFNNLLSIGAGKGYIIKTKERVFQSRIEGTQFPNTAVPVPLKLTFRGRSAPDPGSPLPPTPVKPSWNLIGLGSERDSTVGNLVSNVDLEVAGERLWVSLFAFKNALDILLDGQGNVVRDAEGKPLISLLRGVLQNLFLRSERVAVGGAFWLQMCNDPVRPQCSNTIGPLLEPR